jgi:hypothetical protein
MSIAEIDHRQGLSSPQDCLWMLEGLPDIGERAVLTAGLVNLGNFFTTATSPDHRLQTDVKSWLSGVNQMVDRIACDMQTSASRPHILEPIHYSAEGNLLPVKAEDAGWINLGADNKSHWWGKLIIEADDSSVRLESEDGNIGLEYDLTSSSDNGYQSKQGISFFDKTLGIRGALSAVITGDGQIVFDYHFNSLDTGSFNSALAWCVSQMKPSEHAAHDIKRLNRSDAERIAIHHDNRGLYTVVFETRRRIPAMADFGQNGFSYWIFDGSVSKVVYQDGIVKMIQHGDKSQLWSVRMNVKALVDPEIIIDSDMQRVLLDLVTEKLISL